MKIALLTHFYPPEACAAANRVSSLAKALHSRGHDVTVVTNFPSFPARRLSPRDRFRAFEFSAGEVDVVRLFSIVYKGPASRLVHWCSSAVASTLFMLLRARQFDAVVVSVPPITLALPAVLAAARHRAKLIVDVRDVYPDVAIAMGKWRPNGFLARAARTVTRVLYKRAALIGTVTPTAVNQIAARGVEKKRVLCFPNGCDDVAQATNGHARSNGDFLALYVGNLGLATDIDILVDAASGLADQPSIRMVIAGDGAESDRLKKRLAQQHAHNVEFVGAVTRERAMAMSADADVTIVPLRRGIVDSVPSKLFDALSAGCPVIVAAEGEAVEIAMKSGGAICVPPGDAPRLADALRRFYAMDERTRSLMGQNGREYVRRFHRREAIMAQYADRITAL